MSTAEAPLRKPSLSDTFADIDRRVRAVEFGDPHALREQLGNLEERIHDYVDYLLGTVMNDLYSNDTGVYNWCIAYANNITAHNNEMVNYVMAHTRWAVMNHEAAYHPPLPGGGTQPSSPSAPTIPPFWTVTYPDIPDSTTSSSSSRAAELMADIVARTEAVTAEIIAAHEQDHPPPEGPGHE